MPLEVQFITHMYNFSELIKRQVGKSISEMTYFVSIGM